MGRYVKYSPIFCVGLDMVTKYIGSKKQMELNHTAESHGLLKI